jgi:hypothetical protein
LSAISADFVDTFAMRRYSSRQQTEAFELFCTGGRGSTVNVFA